MSLPYLARLICLCFASFFLVHLVLGLLAWLLTPASIRFAERMRPRSATRLLLGMRLLPAAIGTLFVLLLCLPSYLWLEPDFSTERVGLLCCTAALLGASVWLISLAKVLRAAEASFRHGRKCRETGEEIRLPGYALPLLVVPEKSPLLALAGVLRQRVVVSRGVLRVLSPQQLDAALRHEGAHRISHDNLKRLLLLLAPEVFPYAPGFRKMEQAWARFSEYAADDRAVEGNSWISLSLAGALVRVARLGNAMHQEPLLVGLIDGSRDLAKRVNRLIQGTPRKAAYSVPPRLLYCGLALLGLAACAVVLMRPETFYSIHRLLERFVQ